VPHQSFDARAIGYRLDCLADRALHITFTEAEVSQRVKRLGGGIRTGC
jgi:hypothetical protein